MKIKIHLLVLLLSTAGFLASCASPDPYVRGGQRRGTVAGGVTGAIIGNNVRGINSWEGAAIGAAVGRMAGGNVRRTSRYYGGGGGYYGRSRYYY
jgi:hypothetical protein